MAVVPIKTEPRCKLCSHSKRAEIDALLEFRSKGLSDEKGRRYNEEYVLEILAGWGVLNPTGDNIKGHWKNHCEVVDSATATERDAALTEVQEEMLTILEQSDGTVDGDLLATFKLGMARLKAKIIKGEDPGVSVDHAMKAAAELTRRSHNQAQHELLGMLTGGIAKALAESKQPRQIEGAEVIEAAEFEEVAVDGV